MFGLKAKAKDFLRKNGVRSIELENGSRVKLQNAKTADLVNTAIKRGF
ncbi:hypothetical protein [Lactobacillus taiwanensis]